MSCGCTFYLEPGTAGRQPGLGFCDRSSLRRSPDLETDRAQDLLLEFARLLAQRGTLSVLRSIAREEQRAIVEPLAEKWMVVLASCFGMNLEVFFSAGVHDRRLHFIGQQTTWIVAAGRGLDSFQHPANAVESTNLDACRVRHTWFDGRFVAGERSLVENLVVSARVANGDP